MKIAKKEQRLELGLRIRRSQVGDGVIFVIFLSFHLISENRKKKLSSTRTHDLYVLINAAVHSHAQYINR